MKLIDTHCHLEWPTYDKILDEVIKRAKDSGIKAIITSSVIASLSSKVLELAERYKNFVYPCLGFAPSETAENPESFLDFMKFAVDHADQFKAVGEVGLDYYWVKEKEKRKFSEECFKKSISLANKLRKPIVIHCRDAEKRAIELLEENYTGDKVHMHCFSGSTKLIERCVKNGWFLSVPTSVVNRKSHKILAENVPLEQMMLETDGPFLSPIPGQKINESKNIEISAKFIAELKNINVEEIAEITTENAVKFYTLNNLK